MINNNIINNSSFLCAMLLLETNTEGINAISQTYKIGKQPNILFCIADDAGTNHMGAYNCKWINTPSFDKVAKQGLLFTNAYTPNAKCAPSRACILTGRNSWQLEEVANHNCYFPAKFKSIAEILDKAGYQVGYTGKGWAPGDMGKIDGRNRDLLVKEYNNIKTKPPTKFISNDDYSADFKQFLDERDPNKPFFFWYGGREPHRPYDFQSGIKRGNKSLTQIDSVFSFWPDCDSVRNDILDYAFEIEYFDKKLGEILDFLENSGELENTLIVVTSDNGMPFPRIKGQAYEYSNHLPLAIMWEKGIKNSGRVIDDYVSFIDFVPTFVEISGVNAANLGMQPITGKSLTDILYSEKSGKVNEKRDHVLIGKERHDVGRPMNQGYPIRGIIKNEYLYLKNYETSRWPVGNPEMGYPNTDGGITKSICLNTRRMGITDKY